MIKCTDSVCEITKAAKVLETVPLTVTCIHLNDKAQIMLKKLKCLVGKVLKMYFLFIYFNFRALFLKHFIMHTNKYSFYNLTMKTRTNTP